MRGPHQAAGRPRSAWVLGVLLVLVIDAAALGVLRLARLPVRPADAAADAPVSTSASAIPAARIGLAETPAETLVEQVLDPGPSSWSAAGPVSRLVANPFTYFCSSLPVPAPAVAGERAYSVPGLGPVTVTVRAYNAGAGAVAFDNLVGWLGRCRDQSSLVGRYSDQVQGVPAVIGWLDAPAAPASPSLAGAPSTASRTPAASATASRVAAPAAGSVTSMFWERSDVLAQVTVPSLSPSGLGSAAAAVDAVLQQAMPPLCASLTSSLSDTVRSPWVDRAGYVGWRSALPVEVPPVTPASADAAPAVSSSPSPAGPSVDPNAPLPVVTLPTRPADPVWPTALPSPVARPSRPTSPSPMPTATSVGVPQFDAVGPGCGWAFTGLAAPTQVGEDTAQQTAELVAAARDLLLQQQQRWLADVAAYTVAEQQYVQQVAAFVSYAAKVHAVASAWAAIQQQRDAYAAALAAFTAGQQAYDAFVAAQAQAAQDYAAQLAACAVLPSTSPSASPSASARASVSRAPTASPTPSPAVTPTLSPSPSDSPTPAPTPTCPPVRPVILDQTPPPSPVPPSSPPAPSSPAP